MHNSALESLSHLELPLQQSQAATHWAKRQPNWRDHRFYTESKHHAQFRLWWRLLCRVGTLLLGARVPDSDFASNYQLELVFRRQIWCTSGKTTNKHVSIFQSFPSSAQHVPRFRLLTSAARYPHGSSFHTAICRYCRLLMAFCLRYLFRVQCDVPSKVQAFPTGHPVYGLWIRSLPLFRQIPPSPSIFEPVLFLPARLFK